MRHLFIAATATVAMLASCTSEVIPERPVREEVPSPIEFSGTPGKMTRATTGADAAALLSNKFVVFGYKDGGAKDDESGLFMNGYVTNYNTTSGEWEYSNVDGQYIRYWDAKATSYTFAAYSNANNNVTITNTANQVGPFTVPAVTAAQLGNIYFTPQTVIPQAQINYSAVNLAFSNAAAKVRVAFYNTILGYHVRILGFYESSTAADDAQQANVIFFGDDNSRFVKNASYNVVVSPKTDDNAGIVYNQTIADGGTASFLSLGTGVVNATDNVIGGPSISLATFDNDNKGWTYVHPQPENNKTFKLRVKYLMYASGDVHDAEIHEVIIPAEYAQWKPNHAYTYFFKITDSDLHPISFEAVVEDFKFDETITTVDPSNKVDITTYSEGSNVQGNDQYSKGENLYVKVTYPENELTVVETKYAVKEENFDDPDNQPEKVDESNCEGIMSDDQVTWTPFTGTTAIHLSHEGYYVFRVKWQKKDDTTVTGYAYKVIKVTK